MSSVPSIRVDCSQCKRAFWVKLKKGIIPSVIVACPNCAYAWDLGQHSASTIVQRSYAWDELITRIGLIFQPQKREPILVSDESEELFREANTSGDSTDWHVDMIELQVEPLMELEVEPFMELEVEPLEELELEPLEDSEVIPFSPEEISEELGEDVDETPQDETPQDEAPQGEAPQDEAPQDEAPQDEAPQDEAPQDETPQGETSVAEGAEDEFEDMSEAIEVVEPPPQLPPNLPAFSIPKITLPIAGTEDET